MAGDDAFAGKGIVNVFFTLPKPYAQPFPLRLGMPIDSQALLLLISTPKGLEDDFHDQTSFQATDAPLFSEN